MKTIDIKSGDNIVQFTTNSVTIQGKEYFYSQMSKIAHSSQRHIYSFTYDGEIHLLPYEEKDSKILSSIFVQVYNMHNGQQAKAAEPQQAGQQAKATEAEQAGQQVKAAEPQQTEQESAVSDKNNADSAKDSAKEKKTAEKAEKRAAKKAEKEKKKAEKAKKTDETAKPDKTEKAPMSSEKKERLKKSLIIFALIVIIIAAISVIYGTLFGTNSAPKNLNPNSNESQQYDEIDQLIDDLQ